MTQQRLTFSKPWKGCGETVQKPYGYTLHLVLGGPGGYCWERHPVFLLTQDDLDRLERRRCILRTQNST